ncbi:MAG: ATP-dependent sacrificial sulfur transferase LarE [Desulfatiglans sp.]|jgi:uncharacterized protein|nr:ATP-dependent sacrificial sulfur transferase LarE [Desulfatiglans sp.]
MQQIESRADNKKKELDGALASMKRVIIAFSGGVDSTFLLAEAARVLGPQNVLAVTGFSASMPGNELQEAVNFTKGLGVEHQIIHTEELKDPLYVSNSGDRCYHCRKELLRKLDEVKKERGFGHIIYGAVSDDLDDHRPGMRAAKESGASAPLMQAGLTKEEIRILSREMGLPAWDKPASPCLASRIPYGTPISEAALKQVEKAEYLMRNELGIREIRVRHHGQIARIETSVNEFERLLSTPVRKRIVEYFKGLGFSFISLDLEGFRSGRMNEALLHIPEKQERD